MEKDDVNPEWVAISEIIPYEKNPRRNDKAVNRLAELIKQYGFRFPILLDKNNVIVSGHTRLKAAIKLGMREVPVMWATDLNEKQIQAFRIADNKSSEWAEWDLDMLKEELIDLRGLNYELDLTGFSEVELNKIAPDVQEEEELDLIKEPKYKINKGEIYGLGAYIEQNGTQLDVEILE
jgi:ParB-like chromosome segregation protein Spo0J